MPPHKEYMYKNKEKIGIWCQLTRKDALFTWTEEHKTVFDKLKVGLTRAPVFIYPDFKQPFEIYTNASIRTI